MRAKEERLEAVRRQSQHQVHYQPFKAKPVPVSTVEPRFEQMMEKAQARREQIVSERRKNLREQEKPFSFQTRPPVPRRRPRVKTRDEEALEYKFKAAPVPPAVSMRIYEQMQRDEAVRRERVNRVAQEKLAAASLPPRMELYDKMGKVNAVAHKQELSGASASVNVAETFKPKINPMSPAIPPFQEMQKRFEHELAKRKQSVPPTRAQPFSMYTDQRPNRMDRVLRDIERDALVLPEQRWPHASTRAPTKYDKVAMGTPPPSAYRTTLAAELRRASLEDEQELRRAIERQKMDEDRARTEKQKRIQKEVAAVLKPTFVTDESQRLKRREQFLEDMRERKENWERTKKQIETNVHKRPYLFEQASAAVHADRARQERLEQFEQTLRDNGLGDLIDG